LNYGNPAAPQQQAEAQRPTPPSAILRLISYLLKHAFAASFLAMLPMKQNFRTFSRFLECGIESLFCKKTAS
jgi:hypothetical protein